MSFISKFISHHVMFTPPLAYPTTVFTSVSPAAVAENTSSRRVCAVTGIANPVVMPLEMLPKAMIPVSGGASVTTAPGTAVNALSGVGELNNCAVMVTVEPTKAKAAVVLK